MDRGQAHTLEAFAAALVLLASLTFALQVTAVTPLTASTSSQHIENQQKAVAEGILAAAAENETLEPTLLFYDEALDSYHETTTDGQYANGGPPTPLGEDLDEAFLKRGIAYNLHVHYLNAQRERRTVQMVTSGEPSDQAVSATRQVTLYDDDVLYDADFEPTGTEVNGTGVYTDAYPDTQLYNVVVVEVTVWRM